MAKVENPLGITGTFGGVTIYRMNGQYYMRTKGVSIDRDRFRRDQRFIKTRECQQDFGTASKAARMFRHAVNSATKYFSDPLMSCRLTQFMVKVIQMDNDHPRGSRSVDDGLKHQQAKALLRTFDFNLEALLSSVLRIPWKVDMKKGILKLPGFIPSKSLVVPEGATHFSISGVVGILNFTQKTFNMKATNIINSAIISKALPVILIPMSEPKGCGFMVYLLKVEFFILINNKQHPLEEGKHNVLSVIEIL